MNANNLLSQRRIYMPLVFKQTRGKQEDFMFLRKSEVLLIMHLSEAYGWRFWGTDPLIFNEIESKRLCGTLEKASIDITATCPPDCDCPDCTLQELTTIHHMEVIKSFLDFCEGHPFWINFEN
jgi:hypothetical protein